MLTEMIKKSGLQLCVAECFPYTTAPQHLQTYYKRYYQTAQKPTKALIQSPC